MEVLQPGDTPSPAAPAAAPIPPLPPAYPARAGVLELSFSVPGGRAAPNAARRVLLEHDEALPEGMRADLLLLLSELVANAVIHGRVTQEESIRVDVRGDGEFVRVEVTDPGAGFDWDRRRRERPRREGGYGLALVERIATRWGIERRNGHTSVWFELKVPAR